MRAVYSNITKTFLLVATPTACVNGTVRLIQQNISSVEGPVQVCLGNTWGTICDDGWGQADAAVVCRQIGYPSAGAIAVKTGFFSLSYEGNVVLSGVGCEGTEDNLFQCSFTEQPFECPSGSGSVGVVCTTGKSLPFAVSCDVM